MTWERALEADARLAARNSVLIRAALRQSFDPERAFIGYQNTTPDDSLTLPQQRSRARSWAIMNIRPNLEPLRQILIKIWAEAYALGDLAAREAITEQRRIQKADTKSLVDWSKWKPGDAAQAIILKPPRAFQRLLEGAGITLKGFSDTTLTDIGNAIGEAIELGLDAKRSAKLIGNYVASPARALTIAITEQNRAISTATQNRYLDAGIKEQTWLVFEPCKICAQNAGQKVSIGAPFPSSHTQPPAHPNCRCALAPIIPGFDDPANTAGGMTAPVLTPEGNLVVPPPVDYRGYHQAPTRADGAGAPAYKIDEEMMPDFYERPNIYTTGMPTADKESVQALMAIRNNPEAMITIYRAVPEGVTAINPGDWVTMSRSYAETHLLSNLEGGHVISFQVRAKDLWFDGNSINEFGYDPVADAPKLFTSNAGKNIEPELRELFKTDPLGRLEDRSLSAEIEEMNAKDMVQGGSRGDNFLKKIVQMQGFDGKPQVVETAQDIKELAKTVEGKILYRGLADYSEDVAQTGRIPDRPRVTLSAEAMVKDFVEGDYRAGWGAFGSGTYTTERSWEASGYALSTDNGGIGSGAVMTMFLPDTVLMPTKEVVKETMKEVIRESREGYAAGNIGRALAAKGYQAYDVGFLQEDKAGIYVILDRSAITVARKADKK